MTLDHSDLMMRAIELGRTNPSAPFGALIADAERGEILVEAVNRVVESPTRHGEMVAIDALARLRDGAERTVLYTTAEPCPMCMSAILWAGIGTVVYGTSIPSLVRMGWHQISIRAEEVVRRTPFAECELIAGVREKECDRLFAVVSR
ncbi:MAG: nucleoside deaminase [Planctomycetota bacterium]|jgi:tRNA(Arg) A34 adenosine deaminase TadA